ncbi:cytochrome-c peroxidase [Flavobacterium sp. xlx-214]|uniref:cytochrome-c peroxidase n=1 Tax=unclassified Flavobacterium TaxID=196869 RepID=UPI0013D7E113|nr:MULTISPECIES: cytochrome c peroxidase [unclassified Flavobacterium]MBA5793383.1 cytochrome-c peroxidase [Flavobacterium sp. xlx-221]QMI84057.1 cytochrome-c peroxidase [Flavobacterium sp. xlx-214]
MNKFFIFFIVVVSFLLLGFFPAINNYATTNPPYDSIVQLYKTPIGNWPSPTIDKGVNWQEFESIKRDSNYFKTQEIPEVALGKMLFFDPKLSSSNQISCSTCHDPEMGWSDKRRVALGHDHLEGKRNTMSLLNIADRKTFFWDGRATSLEQQLEGPITAHNEMAANFDDVVLKLSKIEGYKPLFDKAYGTTKISFDKVAKALAAFQRSIKSQPSNFDKFIDGKYTALTDEEIYGLHLFRTKARCMNCHFGKNLTDESFHNIGLTYYKREYQDLGRFDITKDPKDVGTFKTPSLRDLLLTRPWMHNGLFDNLEGVVNLYNSGMHMIDPTEEQKKNDPNYPYTDALLKPLNLTKEEKKALVAFLESLSGTTYKMRRPEFPTK